MKKDTKYPLNKDLYVCGMCIEEDIDGVKTKFSFITQMYQVGIYFCINQDGRCVFQGGFDTPKQMDSEFRKTIQSAFKKNANIVTVSYKEKEHYNDML